jgi:hypothetical protein
LNQFLSQNSLIESQKATGWIVPAGGLFEKQLDEDSGRAGKGHANEDFAWKEKSHEASVYNKVKSAAIV